MHLISTSNVYLSATKIVPNKYTYTLTSAEKLSAGPALLGKHDSEDVSVGRSVGSPLWSRQKWFDKSRAG